MAVGGLAAVRIRVLGAPSVADDWPELAPREADLLVALALTPNGRHADWLRRNLWPHLDGDSTSTVSTHVGYLRKRGVDFRDTRKGGPYRLDYDDDAIDCRRFVRCVGEFSDLPDPGAIDDLLRLWLGNPWERSSQVPESLWASVRQALRTLLEKVAALGDEAGGLQHWAAFEQMLAGEPLLDTVRSPVPRPPKRQVLIVDDRIGREMADVLGDFDSEVIDSLAAWNRRKDDGRPFRHVCALVDLHLKKDMTDRGGLVVLRDLQERTSMPIVLMSAELPPFEDSERLRADLGVDKVLPKHNRACGDFARLRDVVRELAG